MGETICNSGTVGDDNICPFIVTVLACTIGRLSLFNLDPVEDLSDTLDDVLGFGGDHVLEWHRVWHGNIDCRDSLDGCV